MCVWLSMLLFMLLSEIQNRNHMWIVFSHKGNHSKKIFPSVSEPSVSDNRKDDGNVYNDSHLGYKVMNM